jgi:hypothetical protein
LFFTTLAKVNGRILGSVNSTYLVP